jgi:hypothetical protein
MTRTGALIMATFATVWWIVGMRAAGHVATLIYSVPLVVALMLGAIAWRHEQSGGHASFDMPKDEAQRRDRVVMWASAVEGVALFIVAGVVRPSIKRTDATASAVALIVGAHFLPLARWLPAPVYYLTAAVLVALGLAGFFIGDVNTRLTTVSSGAAIVLWLTAASALLSSRRSRNESGLVAPE